ncbi:MAG: 8-oxo-dGTP pyrophosphatase MutT (NUDIX family) [Oleispira sp.]|jgi:8-oxo-dGTP pyrophosphatase MutT (NUDIX family)
MAKDDIGESERAVVNSPWQTLSRELKYDNPWIRVEEYQVINPAGGAGIYGTVSFKNRAVAIVALFENGDTLLVGQYRYPLQEYHWELPMGGAPEGESALECAQRELQEETGFRAARWQQILSMHLSNSITQEQGFTFIAEELQAGEMALEETEDITCQRVPFERVFQQVMAGEITDAMTVASIMKVRLLGLA